MTTELIEKSSTNLGIFASEGNFQIALRAAEMISQAPMIPDTYKGNPGSCLIAINTANRLGIDFLMVMQNLYIVKGKPAWSGSFVRALLNIHGKYEELTYEWQNPEQRIGCRMIGIEKGTRNLVEGAWITPTMVKAEGWGHKWNTMPEQMYMYRAAAFFARAHCPEAILGLQTTEEIEDTPPTNSIGVQAKPIFKTTETPIKEDIIANAKIIEETIEPSSTPEQSENLPTSEEPPREVTDLILLAREEGYSEEELNKFCKRALHGALNKENAEKILNDWEHAKKLINTKIRKENA